jgi:hypothetical protein
MILYETYVFVNEKSAASKSMKAVEFTKQCSSLYQLLSRHKEPQCAMIYGQNADGINVFPILHRHVPPRFNAFLATEWHQSLATAKLIVDTDTI